MIDHVGFAVSDQVRGESLLRAGHCAARLCAGEGSGRGKEPSGFPAAGFGAAPKAVYWIGGEGKLERPLHVAIVAKDRAAVDAFYEAALAAGGKDNGASGLRPQYHPDYYAAFVFDLDGHNIQVRDHTPRW